MKAKLIRIERSIVIYSSRNEIIKEIPINIHLEELLKIVEPYLEDPMLYEGYELSLAQLDKVNGLVEKKIKVEMDNYCVLECTGIYGWDAKTSDID